MTDKQRPQLHVTALDTFARCGEQFRQRYILGRKRAPAVAQVVGSGVHLAVAANFNSKLESGELLPVDQVIQQARDAVDRSFQGEIELDPEECAAGKSTIKGAAIDSAVRLAEAHAESVAPAIEPVTVERSFSLRLDEFLAAREISGELDLVGTIDLEQETEDGERIRDLKTTRRAPQEGTAAKSTQLAAYAVAKRVLDGRAPAGVALDYLVDGARVRHIEQIASAPDALQEAALLNRVAMVAKAIEKGVFPPVEPGHWTCSRKFCGYYDLCPYTANPHSMLVQLSNGKSS